MKKYKFQQYFCFIVSVIGLYAFWFSFSENVVTLLISTTTLNTGLIKGDPLISMWIPKGVLLIRRWRLFEAQCLLEEIRYLKRKILVLNAALIVCLMISW